MERCCENCFYGQEDRCEESNCYYPSLSEFRAINEVEEFVTIEVRLKQKDIPKVMEFLKTL